MKNNNWQKNTREQYNTKKPQYTPDTGPAPFLKGTSIAVWNDDVNSALRKLKKVLEADNRQKDSARHEFYEKPTTARKRAKDTAKSRWQKEVASKRASGGWVDTQSSDLSWMRTKKKRRVHSELQKTIHRLRG